MHMIHKKGPFNRNVMGVPYSHFGLDKIAPFPNHQKNHISTYIEEENILTPKREGQIDHFEPHHEKYRNHPLFSVKKCRPPLTSWRKPQTLCGTFPLKGP